ncbi:hypothetical protein H4R35_000663 [Dimargaris xerosporica]|nr:hypothetical protein H4R35_000663 [Dimargaris xerosporica]
MTETLGASPKPFCSRRNMRGMRFEEMNQWTMDSPEDSDTPFGVREYLQTALRRRTQTTQALVEAPTNVDPNVWVYEHLREVCIELNFFIAYLRDECTRESCPEMVVGEWRFLCAAHRPPQSCAALEYIVHTHNGATSCLTDIKHFPFLARVPERSMKMLKDIARRLDRVFAHAYHNHRKTFLNFENHYHTYSRFSALINRYSIVQAKEQTMPELARA